MGTDSLQKKVEELFRQLHSGIISAYHDEVDAEIKRMLVPVKITKYALEKANFIARSVKTICGQLELPTYEVAFYLLAEPDEAAQGVPVIRDVYVAHEQEASPSSCKITGNGAIASRMDIRNSLRMIVAGWGHSHGDIHTCFSKTDWETFKNFFDDHRMSFMNELEQKQALSQIYLADYKGKRYIQISGTPDVFLSSSSFNSIKPYLIGTPLSLLIVGRTSVLYTYAMVFNAPNDLPYAMVAYGINGQTKYVEEAPILKIDDGRSFGNEATEVQEQIKKRVSPIARRIGDLLNNLQKDCRNAARALSSAKEDILPCVEQQHYDGGFDNAIERCVHAIQTGEAALQEYNKKGFDILSDTHSQLAGTLRDVAEYVIMNEEKLRQATGRVGSSQIQIEWPLWKCASAAKNQKSLLIESTQHLLTLARPYSRGEVGIHEPG